MAIAQKGEESDQTKVSREVGLFGGGVLVYPSWKSPTI